MVLKAPSSSLPALPAGKENQGGDAMAVDTRAAVNGAGGAAATPHRDAANPASGAAAAAAAAVREDITRTTDFQAIARVQAFWESTGDVGDVDQASDGGGCGEMQLHWL